MKLSSYFVISLLVLALLPNVLSSAFAAPSPLPVNPAWHALGGSGTTANNVSIHFDPLANDITDGSPNTVFFVTQPLHGTATFDPISTLVTYTPDGTPGTFTFTYQDCTSTECSDVGTFTIKVTGGSNSAPVGQSLSFSVNYGSSISVPVQGSDADGDIWWITSFSGASHGNVIVDPADPTNKTLLYTPTLLPTPYSGPDSFTYTLSDGMIHGIPATVSVTITPVNHPPTASNSAVAGFQNTPLNIVLSATDIDGNSLTYTILSPPTHGILSGTAPNLVYTPALNFYGGDSFTWKANDGTAYSNNATVSISINHVYQSPVAHADKFTVNQHSPAILNVLANDTSFDITQGFPVTLAVDSSTLTQPTHGTVVINPDRTVTYSDNNYFGPDSFTYRANIVDTGGNPVAPSSSPVTVTINVNRVLGAPVITTPSQYTNVQSQTITGTADYSVTVNLYDGTTLVGSTTSDSTGHWSIGVTLSQNAEHILTAQATFTSIPNSPLSNPISITEINTTPTLSPVHIQSSNTNHALAKPGDTVTLTFTSAYTIQAPSVTIAGHAVTATSAGGNNWSAQWTMFPTDIAGPVPFTINFQDLAGNVGIQVTTSNDASSVSFDNTNPTVSIIDPANLSLITAIHVKINGTADDTGSGLQKVEVQLDSGSFVLATLTPGSPSHWTLTVNPSSGLHSITARATDNVGNVQTTTSSFTITVPTPPTLSPVHIQSSNTNPALAKPGDTVTLTFTSSTTIQIPIVTIAGHTVIATNTGGNNWSAQYVMTSSDVAGLVPFTINYQDLYGGPGSPVNSVTTDASSVSFDKTNPTISITQPANNALIKLGTLKINGTADDTGSGLQKVEVQLDSGSFVLATLTPGSPSHWTLTTSPTLGPHTITARATDNAGNVQITSISINVVNNTPGKVTGGGGVGDSKFAFEAKSKDGLSFKGNLEFKDKPNHFDLKSTSITSLFVDSTGTKSTFSGTAKVNGHTGYTFNVYIEDNGEPGKNVDVFSIQIFDSHGNLVDSVNGVINKGNIQIHNNGNSGDDDKDKSGNSGDDDKDFKDAIKQRDS